MAPVEATPRGALPASVEVTPLDAAGGAPLARAAEDALGVPGAPVEVTPLGAPAVPAEAAPRDTAGGTPDEAAAEAALPCAGKAPCIFCFAFRGRPGSSAIAPLPRSSGHETGQALWDDKQRKDKDGMHRLVCKVGLLWGLLA